MKRGHEMNMWNSRSLYRPGSLSTVARELARYKAYLVVAHVVRWDKGGTVRNVN
jgi:hypothetical protein